MPRYKQRSPVPIILILLGVLLLITAVVLGLQNIFNSPTDSAHEETYPEIQRVTLTEAKAALDAGSALFVDVRSAQAYRESHITGSINIPLAELEQRINELDPARWIITYCT